MRFIDLDKQYILDHSEKIRKDGRVYHEFKLGEQVQVITNKDEHKNLIISRNLASQVEENGSEIRYIPSSSIYFTNRFLTSNSDASIKVDENSLYIGALEEFPITKGVITFSGWLNDEDLVAKDTLIYGNTYTEDNLKDKCRVLGLGVRKDKIFGIYYIPNTRGILLGVKTDSTVGLTTTTFEFKPIKDFTGFSIKDWFDGAKIRLL